MTFVLSSQNVFEYLQERGLCSIDAMATSKIEQKYAKNFNLLLNLPNGVKLLVKQEPRDRNGTTAGEFLREWRIQEFLAKFPELIQLRSWISDGINFNPEDSIIVFNYLDNYRDLMDFYNKENQFPPQIATNIGYTLAEIHRRTFKREDYQEFFTQTQENPINIAQHLVKNLERITPSIFGAVPGDGIKFYALFQRYDSLGQAIAEVSASVTPSCLTHNDLKLNNILLSNDWEHQATGTPSDSSIRFIDWERCGWGDPAFDLGSIIGSYLLIWLGSLITSKTIKIEDSLRMATTPLEELQPSIAAFTIAYLNRFPEILNHRPDFLNRVVQYSGWMLISAIQSTLQYQKSFGNGGICMLQVAKSLLCRPQASISTIFGQHIFQ